MAAETRLRQRHAVEATERSGASGEPPHVFILSDVRLFREGLAVLLPRDGSVTVAGAGPASKAAKLVTELKPDILLLDATLKDLPNCAQQVRQAVRGIKIVAFALGEVDKELITCAEAGASAFVGRDGSYQDLLRAIDEAWRGECSVSPHHTALLLGRIAELAETGSRPSSSASLTRREREIVPLIERGLSNKEIARHLSIGTATIKNHVHNILEKMQLRRRGEIAGRVRDSSALSEGIHHSSRAASVFPRD
jgi:two-component system nitrate/nitrite response regulator NarL